MATRALESLGTAGMPPARGGHQGLALHKARVRDPRVWWAGTYGLSDACTTALVAGDGATANGYGLDLDDVEVFIAVRETT